LLPDPSKQYLSIQGKSQVRIADLTSNGCLMTTINEDGFIVTNDPPGEALVQFPL